MEYGTYVLEGPFPHMGNRQLVKILGAAAGEWSLSSEMRYWAGFVLLAGVILTPVALFAYSVINEEKRR